MAANEKEEITSEAPAEESLPTESRQEPKKKTMLLAVIIAVIVVIAAVAAVIGLGLLGGEDEEPANVPPSGGARALTGTTIFPGDSVSFESLATDSDGEIVNYTWMYGDGIVEKTPTLNETTHTYDYAGTYLVYHEVEDDAGDFGNNEAQMIGVSVLLVPTSDWQNDSEPIATMIADKNVIPQNTTVTFNMTGSSAPGWSVDDWAVVPSWENISEMTLDFGDGSAVEDITPEAFPNAEHMYTAMGHYVANLTVTSEAGNTSTYMITIHVLTPEGTYEGLIKNPDAFVMVSIGEPDYLDPAIDYETAGGEVSMNVYETLVWYDGASTVDLKPVLATEVPTVENGLVSADGKNYTFNIRDGVTFHDGTDMTVEDVVYSAQRVLRMHDPAGPSWMIEALMTCYLSFYIDGTTTVGDWTAGETVPQWLLDGAGLTDPDAVLDEAANQAVAEFMVTQVDADTVNFRLTTPYPAFVKICAFTMMSIVSMDYVEANGGIVNGEHNDVMIEQPCGTGPYILPDGGWEHGTKIHMVRNDNYWGTAPALKDIYLITVTDQNTRILMLQAGDADCIALSIEYESMFATDDDYDITKGLPTFDMTFAGFNMDINTTAASDYGSDVPSDFFTDPNVRAAFVRMFDSDIFIENVLKGNAIQPNGPIPKGMFGYDDTIPTYAYNLDEAKTYLEAAINPDTGNSWWVDGFSIALFYNAGNTYRETACLYIQEALADLTTMAAGDTDAVFAGVVNTLDWPTYLAELRKSPSPFPIFYLGWAPDYADPDNYVTPFLHSVVGTFTHSTGYANTTLDDMITEAAVELDVDLRADMYSAISMSVYQDAPYLWLWQGNNFHIERSWVNGYYHNPMYAGFYYPAFSKG